jgi:glycosyltransferase involved in cell wall biosynthesis
MVTFVIPVYNLENYILRCLTSLLEQTCSNFEAIIVDDGSTDASNQIIKDFISKNSMINMSLISTKNNGVSSARNTGLSKSVGDYVVFIDGDDYLEKDAVKIINDSSKNNPNIIVFKYNSIIDKTVEVIKLSNSRLTNYGNIKSEIVLNDYIFKKKEGFDLAITGTAYNRFFLNSKKLIFTPKCQPGEDTEFILKAVSMTDYVLFVDELISFYLVRYGSSMTSINIRRFDGFYAYLRLSEKMSNSKDLNISSNLRKKLTKRFKILAIRGFIRDYSVLCKRMKSNNSKASHSLLKSNIEKNYPILFSDMKANMFKIETFEISFVYLTTLLFYITYLFYPKLIINLIPTIEFK